MLTNTHAYAIQDLTPDLNKPFLHPIIIHILRATPTLNGNSKSIIERFPQVFKWNDGDEISRVPTHLVALAATAACAALMEWSTGVYVAAEFDASFTNIFNEQMETLDDLEDSAESGPSFLPLLEHIYKQA